MLLSNYFFRITCFLVSQLAIHVYPLYVCVYEIHDYRQKNLNNKNVIMI